MLRKEDARMMAGAVGISFEDAENRIIALLIAQRSRFEQAFASQSGGPVAGLEKWRTQDFNYKPEAWFLRGAWHGWRLREHLSGNDPFMGFIMESANEGELAAYDYGCRSCEDAVRRILDGQDTGEGTTNEPWNALRQRLLALVRK